MNKGNDNTMTMRTCGLLALLSACNDVQGDEYRRLWSDQQQSLDRSTHICQSLAEIHTLSCRRLDRTNWYHNLLLSNTGRIKVNHSDDNNPANAEMIAPNANTDFDDYIDQDNQSGYGLQIRVKHPAVRKCKHKQENAR